MKKILTIVAVLIMMSAPTVMAQENCSSTNHDVSTNGHGTRARALR
jgi:hypothetical protein